MNLSSSSSPQPTRKPLEAFKRHSSAHKLLFTNMNTNSNHHHHHPPTPIKPSSITTTSSLDRSLSLNSPALSPLATHSLDPQSLPCRSSTSSSQSNAFTITHTSPGTWSVSGKLVRKKASGLLREAARSWGRSRSKEVLSFGLGVLIGNQDAQQSITSPSSSSNSSPKTSLPNSNLHSGSINVDQSPQDSLNRSNRQSIPAQSTPSSVGTIIKGPKKRLSFHGSKKLKGKSKEESIKIKRRSEIGFGDWADTLNTAVASSSPLSQTISPDKSNEQVGSLASHQPSHLASARNQFTSQSSDSMTLPLRRRDRPVNPTKPMSGVSSSMESETSSSNALPRVPRSTFPHAHRSPRSPRRFYNTRAAVHRTQSSQNLPSRTPLAKESSVNHLHRAYAGLVQTSSPFKRSVSPINQFDDDFDVESPIAMKSHGRISMGSAHEHRLRSASSARANLFGAMPNQNGSLEGSSLSTSTLGSFNPQTIQRHPTPSSSQWLSGPPADHATLNSLPPRSRRRTVSATFQENSSWLRAQNLSTLSEDTCDSDLEVDESGFACLSPSRSPMLNSIRLNGTSDRSSVSCLKAASQGSSDHSIGTERWGMPRIEGLDVTPRRRSLDESCEDSDPDEAVTQAGSSKPSSSATSILSSLTNNDHHPLAGASSSGLSVKASNCGFDSFGALPPPESPFPGPHRFKRAGPQAPSASPNKLKRDVDGQLVGSTSQPTLYRQRIGGQPPALSYPNLRLKCDLSESACQLPSRRDSWDRQSNGLSDEDDDDDELGTGGHHERDPLNNGSHESHEGMSNLSVPGLTDSSSLASSLASSNRSSNQYSLLSSTWDKSSSNEPGREAKRRSLPTHVGRTAVHNLAPVPPLPIGYVSTPLSTRRPLAQHPQLQPLIQSADSSFQENESSFQNVKPNASAFLSSGMVSKKTIARDRMDNSFGPTSSLLQYALLNVNDPNASFGGASNTSSISTEASIAVKSMCEALGGPQMIVAAMRDDETSQSRVIGQDQSNCSVLSAQQATSPSQNSLGIVLPDCLRRSSVSSLRMPDTPIKKSVVFHKSHSHVNKPFVPSGLGHPSNSQFLSAESPVLDNSPTSRPHKFPTPESPIPSLQSKLDPNSCLSIPKPQHSPMFRRRSSDGVISNPTSSGHQSKNSSLQKNNPFDDPGTPTKVAPSWLKRVPQLLTSPGNSISSVSSSPSMQRHVKMEQLIPGNSHTEQLIDPQVTPNRTGSPNLFVLSPWMSMNVPANSRLESTPGHEGSTVSATNRASFKYRHSSPTIEDIYWRSTRTLLDSQFAQRERFDTEFDVLETIGSGEFGEVFKARQESTGTVCAVKRAKRTANGPKALGRQYEEVDILRRLTEGSARSPFIIQLFDAWQDSNRWYIQTEFCENGTLERFLELIAGLQDRIDEERIWKITSELAQAVDFMHSVGILHLDIKPANIFITAHGGLKLGDFGLARRWPRINPNEVRECGLLNGRYPIYQHSPSNSNTDPDSTSTIPSRFLRYEDISDTEERQMMRFKRCGRFVGFDLEREGDREYIAPETLSGRYGEEADVFSVGLIALEIGTNVVLPDNGDEWRSLRSSDFSRTDLSHLSSELVLLIKRMMDKCPDRRITASELIQHPVLVKLKRLRDVGLTQEENLVDGEEVEVVLEDQLDHAGDVQMSPGDHSLRPTKDTIEPMRPLPPAGNMWRTARGAVLPEAEGFLQFILTGQSSPSRLKASGVPAICSEEVKCDDDQEKNPDQHDSSTSPVDDSMEIDS